MKLRQRRAIERPRHARSFVAEITHASRRGPRISAPERAWPAPVAAAGGDEAAREAVRAQRADVERAAHGPGPQQRGRAGATSASGPISPAKPRLAAGGERQRRRQRRHAVADRRRRRATARAAAPGVRSSNAERLAQAAPASATAARCSASSVRERGHRRHELVEELAALGAPPARAGTSRLQTLASRSHWACGYSVLPIAQLRTTRSQGVGCGSSVSMRKTNQRGRLTTPIEPERGRDPDASDRPEVGDDLRDPAPPQRPRAALRWRARPPRVAAAPRSGSPRARAAPRPGGRPRA